MIFSLALLAGLSILGIKYYLNNTTLAAGHGGSLNIAIVGSPRFLNPVLGNLNNADRELLPLFFSSLMKYDTNGQIMNDLAEKYAVGEEGKVYDITLKKDIEWQDGQPLTIDDVIFTLQTIQNPEYKSPFRSLWQGVEYEKIGEDTIRFKIKNPYSAFLHTLTFGIIPKHIWQNIGPAQFPLNEMNLKPLGSGPYQFAKFSKDSNGNIKSMEIKAFDDYFLDEPYISKITLSFYNSSEEAVSAYKKGQINALSFISQNDRQDISSSAGQMIIYSINLPRYFAIFFNQTENSLLADKSVRQALAYAIDRNELVKNVLNEDGKIVSAPILEGMTGFSTSTKIYEFDAQKARDLLTKAGFKDADEDGVLEIEKDKTLQKLEITLTTNDWPDLSQTAQMIQKNWQDIGVKVNLEMKESSKIQNETIKPRQYQALLFGEVLGVEPDPFSFWHSSQKKDPGLNLALYENIDVDNLLMNARQDLNQETRAQKYQRFSDLVTEDLPAIFLYSPSYLMAINNSVKGIEFKNLNSISTYFNDINKWYIETERAWR